MADRTRAAKSRTGPSVAGEKTVPPAKPDRVAPSGGRLRTGNPGNKGGGRLPKHYKMWLAGLLESKRHRDAFTRAMQDDQHPHFAASTRHATEHAYGKPTQPVDLAGALTVRFE